MLTAEKSDGELAYRVQVSDDFMSENIILFRFDQLTRMGKAVVVVDEKGNRLKENEKHKKMEGKP